jgi:magnesium transporter
VDASRAYRGTVALKQLVLADPDQAVIDIADDDHPIAHVDDEAEGSARLLQEYNLTGLVIVDREDRVVGILTVDDALEIIEEADSEDIARQAGALPSAGHYFSSSVWRLAGLRVVWLFILIVAAALTVTVLQIFEDSLEQVTALALFIPLLVGTGGNVGAQAATAAVRALALGEVRPSDVLRVAWRECRVGLLLGMTLGIVALGIGTIVVDFPVATVVGISVVLICAWAATVGASMPLLARAVRIDPAVISAPMVTTLVDATGLIIYFLVAGAVLGL